MELQRYEYLVMLRNSGATNMFGAAGYLENEFELSRKEATATLMEWMESFSLPEEEQPKDGR